MPTLASQAPPAEIFYDDVVPGLQIRTPARVVTQEDIVAFARLTGDMNAIHVDEDHARRTFFGRTVAHGLFGLSILVGLKYELGIYRTSSIASLGWQHVKYVEPIFAGYSVHGRIEYLDKRPSRKYPGRGIVTEAVQLLNQDIVLIDAIHITMLSSRTASATSDRRLMPGRRRTRDARHG